MLGVDLGPDAVSLLQLTRADARLQASHYACEPLPPGAVVDGQVADVEAVGAAIARAREHSGTVAKDAVVALAAPAAVVRLVAVPAGLSEAELEAQLELEAARHLPAVSGPLHLDFELLRPLPNDPNRIQVLLAITHSAPVNQCVAALKRGGLRAAAVDVEALALARALGVLAGQPLPPDQVITLSRYAVGTGADLIPLLAQTIASEDINNNALALLLAYGLALHGMRP